MTHATDNTLAKEIITCEITKLYESMSLDSLKFIESIAPLLVEHKQVYKTNKIIDKIHDYQNKVNMLNDILKKL